MLAPRVLTVGHWQVRHPRIALTLWFGAFFGGGVLVLGSVVTTIAAALNAGAAPTAAEAIMVTMAAWLGVGGLRVSESHGHISHASSFGGCLVSV